MGSTTEPCTSRTCPHKSSAESDCHVHPTNAQCTTGNSTAMSSARACAHGCAGSSGSAGAKACCIASASGISSPQLSACVLTCPSVPQGADPGTRAVESAPTTLWSCRSVRAPLSSTAPSPPHRPPQSGPSAHPSPPHAATSALFLVRFP
eukprot:2957877-Pyramimonas_sp.AAC.1